MFLLHNLFRNGKLSSLVSYVVCMSYLTGNMEIGWNGLFVTRFFGFKSFLRVI